MSEADLNLARAAGMTEHPDNPVSEADFRRLFGWNDPRISTGRHLGDLKGDVDEIREHRSNAMYYAALLHPDTQEVFQDNAIEEVVKNAQRIFQYIWEGE